MARVTIRDDSGERTVELRDKITSFGRAQDNQIVLTEKECSRRHFQIESVDAGYKLVDLESRNGTRVNGKCVNQHLLRPGDRIEVGKATISFEEAAPEPKSAPDAPAPDGVARIAGGPPKPARTERRVMQTRRQTAEAAATDDGAIVRKVAWGAAIFCVAVAGLIIVGIVTGRGPEVRAPRPKKASGMEDAALEEIRDLVRNRPRDGDEIRRLCDAFKSRFPTSRQLAEVDGYRKDTCRLELDAASEEVDVALARRDYRAAIGAASRIGNKFKLDLDLRRATDQLYEKVVESGRRYFQEADALAETRKKEGFRDEARRLYNRLLTDLGGGALPEFDDQVRLARVKLEALAESFGPAPQPAPDPPRQGATPFERAAAAQKRILEIETKLWTTNDTLSPDELGEMARRLEVLEASQRELLGKIDELHKQGGTGSPEMADATRAWLQVKVWVLDAADLTGGASKPPEYGGLYVPMNRAIQALRGAVAQMRTIEASREEVLKRNRPAEKTGVYQKLEALGDVLAGCARTFSELDDFITKGLGRPQLSPDDVPEIQTLREQIQAAQLAMKQEREMRALFRN